MSQPSRSRARGPAQRRRRERKLEAPMPLEERSLLAPFVPVFPLQATFTAAPTPTNAFLGTVTVTTNTATTPILTSAPITSARPRLPSAR